MLDRAGDVIRPALIWCDQRSQPQVDAVHAKLGRENVLRYIANPVLTGFTLPKLLWVRDHEPHHFDPGPAGATAKRLPSATGLPASMRLRSRTRRERRSSMS